MKPFKIFTHYFLLGICLLLGLSSSALADNTTVAPPIRHLWGDIDKDGLNDLFVLDHQGNKLFRNLGNGEFDDVTVLFFADGAGRGSKGFFGDYDQDGSVDLFLFHNNGFSIYHNEAGQRFLDVTKSLGLDKTMKGVEARLEDIDKDGFDDLLIRTAQADRIFRNNKGLVFKEIKLSGVGNSTIQDKPNIIIQTASESPSDSSDDEKMSNKEKPTKPSMDSSGSNQRVRLLPSGDRRIALNSAKGNTPISIPPGNNAGSASNLSSKSSWGDQDWNYWSNKPHMFTLPSGNVGIGTSSPSAKLDVAGDLSVQSLSVGSSGLVANLNADMLDGLDSSKFSQFGPLVDTHEIEDYAITSDKLDYDLTLLGDTRIGDNPIFDSLLITGTTMFDGDTYVDGDADVTGNLNILEDADVTGELSTGSLKVTSTALVANLNADTLDNLDSTKFSQFGDKVDTDEITDLAVTAAKLDDESVTTVKLNNKAVTSDKLGDLAVITTKLNDNAVTSAKLGDLAVTSAKLGDLAVTSDKLDNKAVTSDKLGDSAVTSDKLDEKAVTSGKLGDSAVTSGKLDNKAVTSAKLGDKAVTSGKLGDKAVTSEKLGDKAVTSGKLGDKAVISGKLGDKAVTADKLGDKVVTSGKLGDKVVTSDKLGDLSVKTGKMEDGAVTSDKLATNLSLKGDIEIGDSSNQGALKVNGKTTVTGDLEVEGVVSGSGFKFLNNKLNKIHYVWLSSIPNKSSTGFFSVPFSDWDCFYFKVDILFRPYTDYGKGEASLWLCSARTTNTGVLLNVDTERIHRNELGSSAYKFDLDLVRDGNDIVLRIYTDVGGGSEAAVMITALSTQ